jgi:hypothetical protein
MFGPVMTKKLDTSEAYVSLGTNGWSGKHAWVGRVPLKLNNLDTHREACLVRRVVFKLTT